MKRQEFLKLTSTFIGGAIIVPQFLKATSNTTVANLSQQKLVFIQLNGGNDGLNTIIPFADPLYYNYRPVIGVSTDKILKINDTLGFHPSLKGLAKIQQDGNLWVLQNVGYPQPNRSHFRSMEIWQTATDANVYQNYGWLGRFIDRQFHDHKNPNTILSDEEFEFNKEILEALNVDSINNLSLTGQAALPVTIENFEILKSTDSKENMNNNETLSCCPALDFVRKIADTAVDGNKAIRHALDKAKIETEFPKSNLGNRLKWIAQLIKGDLKTSIYYTSQSGYDTHDNQIVRHAAQLKELDEAVSAFYNELQNAKVLEDITIVIFSEFGRRVKDNGKGTDHGTAAPMFVIEGKKRGAIIGANPDLANLDNGDLIYKTDFRSVYASLLKNKLNFNPTLINIEQNPLQNFI